MNVLPWKHISTWPCESVANGCIDLVSFLLSLVTEIYIILREHLLSNLLASLTRRSNCDHYCEAQPASTLYPELLPFLYCACAVNL